MSEFVMVQHDILTSFGPFLTMWLTGLAVGGIFTAIWLNVLHATRGIMDRFNL